MIKDKEIYLRREEAWDRNRGSTKALFHSLLQNMLHPLLVEEYFFQFVNLNTQPNALNHSMLYNASHACNARRKY